MFDIRRANFKTTTTIYLDSHPGVGQLLELSKVLLDSDCIAVPCSTRICFTEPLLHLRRSGTSLARYGCGSCCAMSRCCIIVQYVDGHALWPAANVQQIALFALCSKLNQIILSPFAVPRALLQSMTLWSDYGCCGGAFLQEPPFDPLAFAKGVTYDASQEAGSPPGCVDNVRRAWQVSMFMGGQRLARSFGCACWTTANGHDQ